MKIQSTLNGENVTIINITGDSKNQNIVYIDQNNNLKVLNEPLDWTRQKTIDGSGNSIQSDSIPSYQLLSGTGNRVWLHGSSTTEQCSTTGRISTLTSAEFNEYNKGYWSSVQARFNSPFELAFNTGVGGSVLSAHTITLSNIISSVSANYFDICFLQYMANDIANNIQISSYTPTITQDIQKLLQAKKKIVLIVPHPKSGDEVSDPDFNLRAIRYVDYLNYCKQMAANYPDQIFVADHYSIFNGGRVPVEMSSDGTHLDAPGSWYVSQVWTPIINKLQYNVSPAFDGYAFGGEVVRTLFGTGSGISTSNASGYYLEPDEYGRSRFFCSASTNVGNINRVVHLSAGYTYKIFLDFELLENFDNAQYSAGAKIQSGSAHRRLLISNTGTWIPGRHRMLSAPMYVSDNIGYTLNFYPGAKSILYGVYLIKV